MVKRIHALVLLLAAIALTAFMATSEGPAVEIGKAVPEFSLTDINGKTHKLSEYKGKIVVLEWTNPNCPFVQRVYREGIMTATQKKAAEKGAVWITINSTHPQHKDFETNEELAKIYKDWKAQYTAFLTDLEGTVGRMFDAKTTPHMFVINKDGKLAYAGAIDDDPRGSKTEKVNYVQAALDELTSGRSVSTATTKSYGCSMKYTP
jgi:peroxiredoxin